MQNTNPDTFAFKDILLLFSQAFNEVSKSFCFIYYQFTLFSPLFP